MMGVEDKTKSTDWVTASTESKFMAITSSIARVGQKKVQTFSTRPVVKLSIFPLHKIFMSRIVFFFGTRTYVDRHCKNAPDSRGGAPRFPTKYR